MTVRSLLLVSLATFVCTYGALAAEIVPQDTSDSPPGIAGVVISGQIEDGDEDRLTSALHAAVDGHSVSVVFVRLNSGGGDEKVAARLSLKLLEFQRNLGSARLTVVVGPHAICASACSFLLVNPLDRVVVDGGTVEVHRVSRPDGTENEGTLSDTRIVANLMLAQHFPQSVADKMLSTPPARAERLTREELLAGGVHVVAAPGP